LQYLPEFKCLVHGIYPYYSYSQINKSQPAQTDYSTGNIQAAIYQKPKIKNDIFIYACQFLSGTADGVNQALVHHYLGMGKPFLGFPDFMEK
jgi:hypothetical protein